MEKIIVGYDGSDTARLAVDEAAALARATSAELHVVNVADGGSARTSMIGASDQETAEEHAHKTTDDLLATSLAAGGLAESVDGIFTHNAVLSGPAAGRILDYASSIDADLIVVGNRRVHGIERLLGSVAIEIVRHAPCSVYVAHTV